MLDLAGEAVPVINYKKLKRAQDASAPAAPAGASARDPMAGNAPSPGAAAAARMNGGLAPGDGAGNHMAAVIRRIEGFYSAPRFDDSDDERSEGEGFDGEGDGNNNENQTDPQSSDDEDFVDDGRDPNDPEVIKAKELKAQKKAEEKAAKALLPMKKKTVQPEEWYDMDDDFIDDDELDEYFERNGRKDKLGGSGGDRFYVNRGDLEFVDDGTGAANALKRSRQHNNAGGGGGPGGKEWTEEDMQCLIKGVKKHGRRWQTIKRDEQFGTVLRDFSVDAVKHKWKNMIRRGIVKPSDWGGEDGVGDGEGEGEGQVENGNATATGPTPTTSAPVPLGEHRAAAIANTAGALNAQLHVSNGVNAGDPVPQKVFGIINPDGTRLYETSGLGKDGVYSETLTNAILEVKKSAAAEQHPVKGSRTPLPTGIVQKLQQIVVICKGPGGEPNSSLPRGILKELMSFLAPFCSPVTLQKRMSTLSEQYVKGHLMAGAGFH